MEARGERKYMQFFLFFEARRPLFTTKTKNGDRYALLKFTQRGLTIAIFLLGQPARLEIAIKMAIIGEGDDYRVVEKGDSFCSPSVCFFVLPRASKN